MRTCFTFNNTICVQITSSQISNTMTEINLAQNIMSERNYLMQTILMKSYIFSASYEIYGSLSQFQCHFGQKK